MSGDKARSPRRKLAALGVAGVLAAGIGLAVLLLARSPDDLGVAKDLARKAEALQREAYDLGNLAACLEQEERADLAHAKREDALRLRREAGTLFTNAEIRLARARRSLGAEHPDVLRTQGMIHFHMGRYTLCRSLLEKVVAGLDGADKAAVLVILGTVDIETGKIEEAVDRYRQAAAADPRSTDARFNLGVALLRSGRPKDALPELRRAAELRPDDAQFQNALGHVFERMLDLRDAEKAYELAVVLAPERGDYRRDLEVVRAVGSRKPDPEKARAAFDEGMALEAAGRLIEAMEAYKKAISLTGGYHAAHYHRGLCLWAYGTGLQKYDERRKFISEAVDHFTAALDIRPGYAPYLFALAGAYQDRGQPGDAERTLRSVIKNDPRSGQAHYLLARLYAYAMEDLERARAELAASGELGVTPDPVFVKMLDEIEAERSAPAMSEEEQSAMREAKTESGTAEVFFELGEYDEAATAFARAFKMLEGRNRPEFRALRARAAHGAGAARERAYRLEEALDWYTKAIGIDPGNRRYTTDAAHIQAVIKSQKESSGNGQEEKKE